MANYPFYYKVKFHLLTRDKENNLKFQDWEKEFSNPNPLKAREEAFEEFEEYLKFLKKSNKLEKDERGNYKIISPSGLPEAPEFREDDTEKEFTQYLKKYTEYLEYREELEVLIIINDDDLMDVVGHGDRVFSIHSVASHAVNAQELIDNLEEVELELYKRTGVNVDRITQRKMHYGEDYEDSEEQIEGALRYILPTPFVWQSIEEYQDVMGKEEEAEDNFESDHLSWKKILENGETNTLELKSSLAYNFSEKLSNWKPLYNNARTIASLLNSRGGLLVIGVQDDGTPLGINKDLELLGNKDKIRLKVDDLMSTYFNNTIASLIKVAFETVEGKEILIIAVKPSATPVFLKVHNRRTDISNKHFFVRRSASTTELKDVEEMVTYIINHWYNSNNEK